MLHIIGGWFSCTCSQVHNRRTMLAMLHIIGSWFCCTCSQVHNRTCMLVPCYQCCMLFGLILLHTFTSSQPYLHAGTMLSMLHVIWVDSPAHVHTFTTVPVCWNPAINAACYLGWFSYTRSQVHKFTTVPACWNHAINAACYLGWFSCTRSHVHNCTEPVCWNHVSN